ncbi:MAG: DUF5110 domain-containing protein [Kiritimatiellae bacterium]|nr:DUF5110 domain-containing protein [Kiritimatiellia bacterium]
MIGDSIRKGYCKTVAGELEGKADVWPGPDAAFTLYEDDGVSLKYRDGECALTEITCKDGKVEIGERIGTYDGMPDKREFSIVRECCVD